MDQSVLESVLRLTSVEVRNGVCKKILKAIRKAPKLRKNSAAAVAAEELVDTVVKNNARGKFACTKGCAHCCYIQTDIFAGEAFLLAKAVKRMPEPKREDVIRRLEENSRKVANLSLTERVKAKIPCALLDLTTNACSVYDSRPTACRKWHGLSVEGCKEYVATGEMPTGGRPKPMVDPQALAAGDAVITLYQTMMKEPGGDLHQGVLLALTPDAEKRYILGEPVFKEWTGSEVGITDSELDVIREEFDAR